MFSHHYVNYSLKMTYELCKCVLNQTITFHEQHEQHCPVSVIINPKQDALFIQYIHGGHVPVHLVCSRLINSI